jgi:hypothetical protein
MAITFTAAQVVGRALTLAGVTGAGETATSQDAQDALAMLNGLIDAWATQRLTLPASQREVFSFTANTSTYSIGPGSTWNTTRPVSIDSMSVYSVNATQPFEIPMAPLDDQSYQSLSVKSLTAPYPYNWYWNATNAATGSLYFWPTPTDASNYQAVLYTPTQLGTFANLATSVTMAPGYYRMLYYNLGRELFPAYGKPLDPVVDRFAGQSLQDIKRINLEMVDLSPGAQLPGAGGIYNINADINY